MCKSDIRERVKNHQFASADGKGQIPHQILRKYEILLSAVFFNTKINVRQILMGRY